MLRFSHKRRWSGGLYLIPTFILVIVVLDLISAAASLRRSASRSLRSTER